MKDITFLGDSLKRISSFPGEAKKEAGYNLFRIQQGLPPVDFKPMRTIGPGTYEIRIRNHDGSFRVFYVTNRPEAVYVLHAFQKKTVKTSPKDIDLGKERYRQIKGGGKG
ncbi:MAG: type II toxin-antitoxin system RelE/ParE family toxin [Synergistota bacterium]|jgi:phage-related protein|nr:type II toxin-antitoxin system RelE/ParE family toxin [Synergistota bacterium]